jgi:hypothetical protein
VKIREIIVRKKEELLTKINHSKKMVEDTGKNSLLSELEKENIIKSLQEGSKYTFANDLVRKINGHLGNIAAKSVIRK